MNATGNDRRIMVIGYGNPLRGDDGVGWFAAQQLSERVDPERIITLGVHQLMPELAETVSLVDRVIFIDAARNQPPGYLTTRVVEPGGVAHRLMTHDLGPEGLLALARKLFGRCPPAHLITVGGENFDHREVLSPAVERACERLVDHLEEMLTGVLNHA